MKISVRFFAILFGAWPLSAGPNLWESHGPDGAYVRTLAIDPQNPSTIYAGADFAGVLKSTDAGEHWAAVNSGLDRTFINVLAIDPDDSATVYAGTDYGGVFKSTDSGASWNPVNAGLPNAPPGVRVLSLAINPEDGNTVYAGTAAYSGGLFKSTDGGENWVALTVPRSDVYAVAIDPKSPDRVYAGTARGIMKSTDAGATWTALNSGLPAETRAFALAIDPQNPGALYALVGGQLFKTSDGGGWRKLQAPMGTSFAASPDAAGTLYVGTPEGSVFISLDGGDTWSPNAAVSGTIFTIAVDSRTPATVYAGTFGGGIFKSMNGAKTWTAVNAGLHSIIVSAIAVNPQTSDTVYATTYCCGLFKSSDGGATWRNAGLGGSLGAVAVDPQNPDTVYATGGMVYKSTDGAESWTAVSCCHGSVVFDPRNTQILYSGAFRSADGGVNWTKARVLPAGFVGGVIAIDPQNPDTLYGSGTVGTCSTRACAADDGAAAVYKSTDSGSTWQRLGPGLGPYNISVLAVDPQNSATIYVATQFRDCDIELCPDTIAPGDDPGLFRSTDGGMSWLKVQLPTQNIPAVVFDPRDSNIVYAGLAKSTDAGTTWTQITSSGLTVVITSLVIDPQQPNRLFAGTLGGGVFSISLAP